MTSSSSLYSFPSFSFTDGPSMADLENIIEFNSYPTENEQISPSKQSIVRKDERILSPNEDLITLPSTVPIGSTMTTEVNHHTCRTINGGKH